MSPDAPNRQMETGYLDLAGIPIVRGRGLAPRDTDETFDVAVVSQEAARRYWPDGEVVGERFRIGTDETSPWIQVLGVAQDIRSARGNEEPDPIIYVPFAQDSPRAMVVLAQVSGDPSALGSAMRDAVWSVDSEQPVDDLRTAEQTLSYYNGTNNALISLFMTFAGFALFMSAIGIYGVMSYSVSQRAGDISIRRALGAESGDVRRMVLSGRAHPGVRRGGRARGSVPALPAPVESGLRHQYHRSRHLHRRANHSRSRGAARQLPTGRASHSHRSHEGATSRVKTRASGVLVSAPGSTVR